MADYQVRSASVFINGRKIGQFMGGTFSIEGGDEALFGDTGGVVVYTDGIIQTKLQTKLFEPVSGNDFDIDNALLTKTNLPMTIALIAGKIYQQTMRPLSSSHTFEVKDGKSEGEYNFAGTSLLVRQ